MGAGDLNQKKSWHPNTMKNQERVWRAEQTDAAEQRRMAELKHEIALERDREDLQRLGRQSGVLGADAGGVSGDPGSKKLEWMYKGSENLLNREEYLLGRQIDKSFEKQDAAERQKKLVGVTKSVNHVEHECIPFSIRQFRGVPANDDQVDLQRKIAEDPLMAVKQRELETRRKLLENPVKLAEIHRLLQKENPEHASDRKSAKKSKKSKKSHKSKRRRSSSCSSTGSVDLDSQLVRQLNNVNGDKGASASGVELENLLQLKYRQINDELQKYSKSRKSSKKHGKSKKSSKRRSDSSSSGSDSDERQKPARKANPFGKPSIDPLPDTSKKARTSTKRRVSSDLDERQHKANNVRKENPFGNPRRNDNSKHRSSSTSSTDSADHKRRKKANPFAKPDATSVKPKSSSSKRRSSSTDSQEHQHKRNQATKTNPFGKVPDASTRHSSTTRRDNSRDRSSSSRHESNRGQHSSEHRSRPSVNRERSPPTDIRSRSDERRHDDYDDSPKCQHRNYGLISASGARIELKHDHQNPVRIGPPKPEHRSKKSPSRPTARKLTEAEREQRLAEMSDNANWREDDRRRKVTEYVRQKEQEERVQTETFDKDFANRAMQKAMTSQVSIESRLRANKNNIQRTASAMSQNFVKR